MNIITLYLFCCVYIYQFISTANSLSLYVAIELASYPGPHFFIWVSILVIILISQAFGKAYGGDWQSNDSHEPESMAIFSPFKGY